MAIQMGCCEAKQAMQECCECKPKAPTTRPAQAECIYDRKLNTLVASSSSDAQRIRHLEENLTVAGLLFTALFVFLCASIIAACAEANRTRSQIDRLHADIDFLESQVFEIGRRK